MTKAVVLLSGGVDSSTTAAIAKADGYDIYALSFDYAQRHRVELEAAKKVAESLGVSRHLIINFDMRAIGGSALTSDVEVPKNAGTVPDLRTERSGVVESGLSPHFSIPITYVPARNTIFLSFALSWAETLEAADIFIGANAVDYSGYPDCRPEYLAAFEKMANLATKISVEEKIRFKINSPLLYMTKAEIIKKGTDLGLDYALTWSCYDPQLKDSYESGVMSTELMDKTSKVKTPGHDNSQLLTPNSQFVPCMRCDSCLIRAKGFDEAGLKDPLPTIG